MTTMITPASTDMTTQASVPFFKHLPSATSNPEFYLTVYAAIMIFDGCLNVIHSAVEYWGQYRAANTIHDKLLDVVMRGSIRFFTVTPVGRIINRFSKDIETIDGSLNSSLSVVISRVANLISAVVVVAVIVPWFLLPALVISYVYWQYSVVYVSRQCHLSLLGTNVQLRVGRSLRRLEATLRSPIFSGFNEILDGIITVRAFSAESRFFKQLCLAVDKTNSASYYYWVSSANWEGMARG